MNRSPNSTYRGPPSSSSKNPHSSSENPLSSSSSPNSPPSSSSSNNPPSTSPIPSAPNALAALRFIDQLDYYLSQSASAATVLSKIPETLTNAAQRAWYDKLLNSVHPRALTLHDVRLALLTDFHVDAATRAVVLARYEGNREWCDTDGGRAVVEYLRGLEETEELRTRVEELQMVVEGLTVLVKRQAGVEEAWRRYRVEVKRAAERFEGVVVGEEGDVRGEQRDAREMPLRRLLNCERGRNGRGKKEVVG